MLSIFRRGPALVLAATVLMATGCNSEKAAPTDPEPQPRPELAGSIYVLQRVSGAPAPFLTSDHTYAGDGTRTRFWILADTLRFGTDHAVNRKRANRQLDETPGQPGNTDDWMTYRSGAFTESGERVLLSWGASSVPIPAVGTDTLQVRDEGLALRVKHPGSCYYCNDGPVVEYLYVRR
jgi:hypothetical protein